MRALHVVDRADDAGIHLAAGHFDPVDFLGELHKAQAAQHGARILERAAGEGRAQGVEYGSGGLAEINADHAVQIGAAFLEAADKAIRAHGIFRHGHADGGGFLGKLRFGGLGQIGIQPAGAGRLVRSGLEQGEDGPVRGLFDIGEHGAGHVPEIFGIGQQEAPHTLLPHGSGEPGLNGCLHVYSLCSHSIACCAAAAAFHEIPLPPSTGLADGGHAYLKVAGEPGQRHQQEQVADGGDDQRRRVGRP